MSGEAYRGGQPWLLCDADGNLFPSEEPAFAASANVTNAFLGSLGVSSNYTGEELRIETTGRNFRLTAVDMCYKHGIPVHLDESSSDGRTALTPAMLDRWVEEEARVVTEHLSRALGPCLQVTRALSRLSTTFQLAVVSSSAILRVQACLDATGLTHCFATENVFSAEDSLPRPLSKPDPAIYLHALERLRVRPPDAIAIEDSVTGTRSAVAAGLATIGNIQFVPSSEREERRSVLLSAGAVTVAESWEEIADLLAASHDSLIAPSPMPT